MSIKKISESWFYNLNDLWEFSKLEIEKGIKVTLFDEWNFSLIKFKSQTLLIFARWKWL